MHFLVVVVRGTPARLADGHVRAADGLGGGGMLRALGIFHYHLTHLGSLELITHGAGAPYQYVRYQPYGEVRGRFDGVGNLITNPSAAYRYEFTGYESEILSGLLYAGAPFYDPTLGLFLTQDPARQFASPYSYGGGDPLNWTDPTGAFFGIDDLIIALVGVAIGFSAAAIQAGVNGASFGEAMRAGAIGGAMAGALAVAGLGVVSLAGSVAGAMGGATAGEWAAWTTALLLTAAGGYSTAEAFQRGQYVVGSVGAVFTAFGLYGLAQGPKAFAQGGNGGGKQLAGLESDASPPDITVEPGLQPGDRTAAMRAGETLRGAQVRSTIARFGANIEAAAQDFGVDADLIRAIIFEEQTHLLPGEGLAEQYGFGKPVGLGQVTEGLHGFTRAQLLDPATNIRAIATHLSQLQGQPLISPRSPIASLATRYNCGSCTAISAYGRRVVFYRSQFLGGP